MATIAAAAAADTVRAASVPYAPFLILVCEERHLEKFCYFHYPQSHICAHANEIKKKC